MITGYATVDLAVQAVRLGADDFIAKPFTSELLLQVIHRELERHRLRKVAERAQALEEEARQLSRAKAEMEKLDSIEGRFMLSMVHTLRAPVAVLQNSIQLIVKGYIPPEEQTTVLERAEQRAGELLSILDDLLLLAYLKEGVGLSDRQPVSLADALETTLSKLEEAVKRREITLAVQVADRPAVLAKPEHLQALWRNLISNAIRYTPQGGGVRVRLQVDEDRNLAVGTVEDTGIGLPPDEIARIFEEFYRTEEGKAMQETGTGLGLPIVQKVLELYGGRIEVESVQHEGSTFRFTLPVAG